MQNFIEKLTEIETEFFAEVSLEMMSDGAYKIVVEYQMNNK